MKLPREFYARDTLVVARELLGTRLVRVDTTGRRRVGRIVETEAYTWPHDRASHSFRGLTPRNQIMFGPPGHAYVYLIYGFWFCLNFVTEEQGRGCAVLLRAIEPIEGIEDKTWGPGLLCRAMDIDKGLNGADLLGETLWLEPGTPPAHIEKSARIGVDYAGVWARRLRRFYDRDSPYVSTAKRSRGRIPDTTR